MSVPEHPSTGPAFIRRRTILAAIGAVPLVGASTFAAATPTSQSTDALIVDLSATRQSIRGFGGINYPAWIGDLTPAQREKAFGNGDDELGFSVLRIAVNPDPTEWPREVETARSAVAHGAIVFASPWDPPADMVETFTRSDQADAQRLRYDRYDAYAKHLNNFYRFMKSNGVDLYAISVQNEPDYGYGWTWWTPEEMLRFMTENAGSIQTRVMAPESFQYRKDMSDPILNNAAALANLDILGAHLYGTPLADFPYPLFQQKGDGKELWMTEIYYPNSEANSGDFWPEALDVGEHMHHSLVDAEFQAYVWWYIRRSYGPMREDGKISKRGYNMAHFSKFIRPGFVRIDTASNPQPDVYTSAYKRDDGHAVIVAVNKQTSPVTLHFDLRHHAASSVSSWLTDANSNLLPQGAVRLSQDGFNGELPAESVTTFATDWTGWI